MHISASGMFCNVLSISVDQLCARCACDMITLIERGHVSREHEASDEYCVNLRV